MKQLIVLRRSCLLVVQGPLWDGLGLRDVLGLGFMVLGGVKGLSFRIWGMPFAGRD